MLFCFLIDALRGLPSLTHLDLGCNRLRCVSGALLSTAKALRTLVLSHNQMVEVPSPLRLPLLRKLWLGGNSIVSLWPWAVAMHNHTSNKGVGCDEGGGRTQKEEGRAEEATWLPSLEQLHLHDNKISRIEAGAFVGMPLLRFLDLAFNRLITTNLSDIQRLWGREITISTAAMTAMELAYPCLVGLWAPIDGACSALVSLNLRANPIATGLQTARARARLAVNHHRQERLHVVHRERVSAETAVDERSLAMAAGSLATGQRAGAPGTADAAPYAPPIPDWELDPLLICLSRQLPSLRLVDGHLLGPNRFAVASTGTSHGRNCVGACSSSSSTLHYIKCDGSFAKQESRVDDTWVFQRSAKHRIFSRAHLVLPWLWRWSECEKTIIRKGLEADCLCASRLCLHQWRLGTKSLRSYRSMQLETTQQDDATNDARIIAAEEAVMASAKNMTANSASPSSSEAPRHKMAPAHQGSGILLQGKGVYGEAPISSSEGNSILWTARQWRCYFCLGLVTYGSAKSSVLSSNDHHTGVQRKTGNSDVARVAVGVCSQCGTCQSIPPSPVTAQVSPENLLPVAAKSKCQLADEALNAVKHSGYLPFVRSSSTFGLNKSSWNMAAFESFVTQTNLRCETTRRRHSKFQQASHDGHADHLNLALRYDGSQSSNGSNAKWGAADIQAANVNSGAEALEVVIGVKLASNFARISVRENAKKTSANIEKLPPSQVAQWERLTELSWQAKEIDFVTMESLRAHASICASAYVPLPVVGEHAINEGTPSFSRQLRRPRRRQRETTQRKLGWDVPGLHLHAAGRSSNYSGSFVHIRTSEDTLWRVVRSVNGGHEPFVILSAGDDVLALDHAAARGFSAACAAVMGARMVAAVVPVQKLWRGFHQRRRVMRTRNQRAALLQQRQQQNQNQNQYRSAATTLQTRFRGFRVRRAMAAALCGAVFEDSDLDILFTESDILLGMDGDFLRELKLGNDAGARASHQGGIDKNTWLERRRFMVQQVFAEAHSTKPRVLEQQRLTSPIVVQRVRHHQQRAQELYHESYDDNAAGYVEECNGLFRENDDPFNAYDHLGPSISRPSSSAYAGSEVSVASSGRWAGAADERMGRCVPEGIRSDDPGCLHADAGAATKEGQTAVNVVASGGQKWTDHPSAFGNCEHKKSMPAHSRAAEGWARLKGGGCGSNKRGGGGGRVEGKRSAAIASWGSGGSQVARDRARHRSAKMRAKQRAPAWYSPTDRGVE